MPRTIMAFLVAGVVLIPARAADKDEPSVQGKTLSEWRKDLKDDKPATRAAAARALATLGARAAPAAPDLVPLLNDRDYTARYAAQQTLRAIGAEAVPALAEALKGKDAALRQNALLVLYGMQVPMKAAVPALTPLLKDANPNVRSYVLPLLARGGEDGVKALVAASKDNVVDRTGVLYALQQAPPSADVLEVAKTVIKDPAANIRQLAVAIALRQGTGGIPVLIEGLKDSDTNVRYQSALNLATFRKDAREAVPALRLLLKDKVAHVRTAALTTLSQIGPDAKEALPDIAALLEDKDATLRQNAMTALAGFGKAALPLLEKLLKNSEAPTRVTILASLPRMGEDAAPLLRAGLKDANAEARAAAADSFGALGATSEETARELTAVLKDEEGIVRQAAAGALWRIEGRPGSALPVLLAGLEDVEQTVRDRASRTLNTVGAPVVLPAALKLLQEKDGTTRRRAALALSAFGAQLKDSVPALIKALAEENAVTRRHLALALARLTPPPEPALKEALSSQDDWQRAGAAEALASTGYNLTPQTLEALATALKDKHSLVRLHAAHALARLALYARNRENATAAVKELTDALKSEEVSLRRQAAASLGQTRPFLNAVRNPVDLFKQTEDALGEALKDRDLSVRLQAAAGLAGYSVVSRVRYTVPMTRTDLVPHFAEGLKKGTREEVLLSAHALASLGMQAEPAAAALTDALKHKDSLIRQHAAYTLGTFGPEAKSAVAALTQTLTDRAVVVRQLSAQALGGIGPEAKDAVPELIKGLKDADTLVMLSSLEALGRIGAASKPAVPALRAILKEPPAVSLTFPIRPGFPGGIPGIGQPRFISRHPTSLVLDALARIGPAAEEAIPDIAAMLKAGDSQRRVAASVLGGMGPAAVPALLEGLKSQDAATRTVCLEALGLQDSPAVDTVKAIAAVLSEKDQGVRRQGVFALSQLGEAAKTALPGLLGVLKNKDNDADTRALAARALGDLGPAAKDAVEALRDALKDDDEYVRLGAVVALGNIGPEARDAVPALSDLARDEHPNMRRAVSRTLDRIQGKP